MDMINLREAPIVDKAEEGATLFVLNTDGSINRISAENVGGSGGNSPILTIKIDGTVNQAIDIGYTYAELREAITNGDIVEARLVILPQTETGDYSSIILTVDDDGIYGNTYGYNGTHYITITEDGATYRFEATPEEEPE